MTTNTLVIILVVISVTIFTWPKWMDITKRVFLQRIYLRLTPSLTYFQTKAIFENVFYCMFGVIAVLLISVAYQIPFMQIFLIATGGDEKDIFASILKVFFESILLILVNSAAIFVWTGLLLPSMTNLREFKALDFTETWMETYMKLSPLWLVILIALLPVFAEELFFRVFINSLLLENALIVNWVSTSIVAVVTSTLFFIIQQSMVLKNRTQILAIGIGSFWIGTINSTAFILGASFYSILLSHYLFLAFSIISMRSRKKQPLRGFQ